MNEEKLIERLRAGILVLLAVAASVAVWSVVRHRQVDSGLMRYGQVPAFQLTGTDDQPFDSGSLQGKVWVASFVFTTCKNSCPMLQAQMHRLSGALPAGPGYALVSITVDPDHDTPAVLAAYAAKLGPRDPRWAFLTGSKAVLKQLIQVGFKLPADPGERSTDARKDPDIIHSSKLVLVDKHGFIRGYYDGLLGESVDAIREDAVRLAGEA